MIETGLESLIRFFTSKEGIQFFSLFVMLDGLICEVVGVFILLSTDYQKIQNKLHNLFVFNKVRKIRNIQSRLNQTQEELRQSSTFNDKGDYHQLEVRTDEEREILEYVLFPEEYERTSIEKIGFRARKSGPSLGDIVLTVDTTKHSGIEIEDDVLDRWLSKAIDRSYYRQGAWLIILGFILMIVATILQIASYWL